VLSVSPAERRFILNQLGRRTQQDMIRLWDAAGRLEEGAFFGYVVDAFPDLIDPAHQMAAELSATWFEEAIPGAPAVAVDPIPRDQLTASAEWALGADGRDKALDRLNGVIQRSIYNGDRDTTIANAEALGVRWVRVAHADACAFCRLLASRSTSSDDLYRSKDSALGVTGRSVRKLGEKYHDHCECTVQAVPPGMHPMDALAEIDESYADLAAQWQNEYDKARTAARSGDDPAKILSAWRELDPSIA